mmetsp:Transcript_68784/g.151520  ORF Transcript_68784/g.151520 Transcript_68784/m.151520 type:complete len:274 (+) Transcript_68784:344-1165(+)
MLLTLEDGLNHVVPLINLSQGLLCIREHMCWVQMLLAAGLLFQPIELHLLRGQLGDVLLGKGNVGLAHLRRFLRLALGGFTSQILGLLRVVGLALLAGWLGFSILLLLLVPITVNYKSIWPSLQTHTLGLLPLFGIFLLGGVRNILVQVDFLHGVKKLPSKLDDVVCNIGLTLPFLTDVKLSPEVTIASEGSKGSLGLGDGHGLRDSQLQIRSVKVLVLLDKSRTLTLTHLTPITSKLAILAHDTVDPALEGMAWPTTPDPFWLDLGRCPHTN